MFVSMQESYKVLGLFQPIDVRVCIKFLSYCDKTFDYFGRLDNKHVFGKAISNLEHCIQS
jgi:hypothetical protein